MRRYAFYLLFILLGGFTVLTSCSEDKSTTGSLTVVAMDSTGTYVPNVNINLAATLSDLQNHNYLKSGLTNEKGAIIFRELLPNYYWASVDNWDDFGSVRVYSGIDQYIVLWLNNPAGKK